MKNDEKLSNPVVDSLYLHIGNSGVTFSVTERMGPTIEIKTSSFGNIDHNLYVYTNTEDMKRLGEMLIKCSEHKFQDKPYCCQARYIDYDARLEDIENGEDVVEDIEDVEDE